MNKDKTQKKITPVTFTQAAEIKEIVEQVDAGKKKNPKDLSSDQDLTIALMNLISIEEHLVFSGAKTGKTSFYDMVKDIRELRKNLMLKVIPAYEGEVWCISKHLLATSMRLMEVGTKQQSMGRDEDAYALFNQAYDLYCLFWGLNMGLIDTDGIKWQDDKIEEVKAKAQELQKNLSAGMKEGLSCDEDVKNMALKTDNNEGEKGIIKGSKNIIMSDNKKENDAHTQQGQNDNSTAQTHNGSMFDKLKAVVKKAVDCCIE